MFFTILHENIKTWKNLYNISLLFIPELIYVCLSEKKRKKERIFIAQPQHIKVFYSFFRRSEFNIVSFSDDEFVIGPCRSTATHDNDEK